MKTTSKILVLLNHNPYEIKNILRKKKLKLKVISDYNELVPEDQYNTVYGFTSISALEPNLNRIERPPLLWESVPMVNQLKLNNPVLILDGKILNRGIIHFTSINMKGLKKVTYKFKNKYDIKIERRKPVQFGNNSKLSILVNDFVSTLPEYLHEPVYIALASSFQENDYTIFDNFIRENRLLTNENKDKLKKLADHIDELKEYIDVLLNEEKSKKNYKLRKNMEIKESISRVRFFLQYFGDFSLSSYMDSEDNISNNLN